MNKRILGIGLIILFAALLFTENGFAERNKEIGVVESKKFVRRNTNYTNRCYRTITLPLFNAIKDLGLSPEWVSMDIFLPENKSKRDNYKRIVISYEHVWFTPEMYQGMTDYVEKGGLLITNSSLLLIDANRNYEYDKEDDTSAFKKPGFKTVGVYGHSAVYMAKIKVENACPLTEGFPLDEWIDLEIKAAGRMTINYSATVLITSDSIYKDEPYKNQPFLTYKHLENGVCIYIVPELGSAETKYLSTILKNALSKKTLEWLTYQGVEI